MEIWTTELGQTPLAEDETLGLKPTWIATRADLNLAEAENILKASQWAFKSPRNWLSQAMLKKLHTQMFGNVWQWAGHYRQTERNLGVAPYHISIQLKQLLDDTQYWVDQHVWPPDEIAARFHHRLVWIHPFANGNGRHARLMADLLLSHHLKSSPFTWGQQTWLDPHTCRIRYIEALREADAQRFEALVEFVRL